MANPVNTTVQIVSTAEPYEIDGVTYQPGYYWAIFTDDNEQLVLPASDGKTYHGPFNHPSDAAFDALDHGYEPGEKLGEGSIN